MDSSTNQVAPVALVIGGSSGIGLATANLLAENGLCVVVAARDQQRLEGCVTGTPMRPLVIDVKDPQSVAEGFKQVGERYGRLDLLVNSAGEATKPAPLMRTPPETWDAQHALHSRGAMLAAQQALRMMRKQRSGTIINIVSTLALPSSDAAGLAGYAAAKAAMRSLTHSLRTEGRAYGVRASAILPAFVDTPLWEGTSVDRSRMIAPRDVAEAVWFLYRLAPGVQIDELVMDSINANTGNATTSNATTSNATKQN